MFRSRKRKVSPDKKPDKSKKLKVSNKIFRSPSTTKPNSEAKSKLSKLLPDGYDSIILTANTKPEESFEENEAVFGCVRLPILTKEDAMVWVKKFERKTFTSYRTQKTWKKDVNTGLFKRKYICNVRKDIAVQATAATCKGSIIFTIKDQEEIQANPDYYLRDYPSQVIIHFCHNHKIDPDSYMKNLRPAAELRIIFGTYFAKGHSPFSALICHKCDLHSSYGAEFYNVVSNGGICPSYNWCFHEYEKFFMRKFLEPPEDKLYEKLNEAVSQYNIKWRSECAVISYNPVLVLSICTPLMKSVFRSGFAEELITVRCFSTPKTVPKRQKLILFLCHTPIGSLPFGVVVTFTEDTETVCEGIRALINMYGVTTYSPKTIIIDENALISKALKKCFPTAQVLLNEFQMLQSIWRIIRVVCSEDDEEFQALYNLFLVTLNSSSEEEFNKNFDSLLVYAEKYPKLTNFLKYFKVRSSSYVLYARPKIEFNTDVLNYTDSGTIILQDVSIKYGNFFNIVQLFDFVSKSYVDHYERKLNKIVEGDLKGFFKTNFFVPLSKIADFTCEKVSDTEFLVSLNEMKFFVNAELDTCTCQVGVHGGSCVHQYIVEKNLGLVPECYTPLCDDMLGIFKSILKEKNIKPPLPDSDRFSELGNTLDSIKSELESVQDADDFSDIVSSVCCSEISNFTGMPHDMDHLCPMEEIFLAPPDINDSFTDITDEAMSPLVLSEFDDTNEDNEDFLDDSQQYNRESGELEPIESLKSTQEPKHQNNVLVHELSSNLEQSIPTTGYFLNQDTTENVIIYEYTDDDIKCNNEVEVMEHCDSVEGETLVHLPTDGSIVYAYSDEKQDQVAFYQNEMNESDRKTAEIAEFLTNLPDTNNSNHNTHNTTPYILNNERVKEQEQTVSNGVVVVRNEEYFTNYEVLENNVLSVVTNDIDAFPQNYEETSQQSAQNLITDSYEDNNFVMMSPNDLFDDNQNAEPDKQDAKINVLSSVVIKPSACSPPDFTPTYTSTFPINLNAIKHKTLRNVKEDSRIRMSELKTTQSGNTIFIYDPSKSEPRKIVLPIVKKEFDLKGIKSNDENKCNQTYEKDVIKLYCNQSSEKPLLEDNQDESETFQQQEILDKTPSGQSTEENVEKKVFLSHAQKLCQSEGESQELDKYLIDTEIGDRECEKEETISEEMILVESNSRDESQEFDQDPNGVLHTYDKSIYSEELLLADCDPAELAKHEFVEIIEIDSDGLEEIASQKYDPSLISCEISLKQEFVQPSSSQQSPVKVIPLKNVPSKMLPFKSFDKENALLRSKCIPLRDFMSKMAPLKAPHTQQKLSSKMGGFEKAFKNKNWPKDLASPMDERHKVLQKQVTLLQPNTYSAKTISAEPKITQTLNKNTEKNKKTTKNNPSFSEPFKEINKIVKLDSKKHTHELKQRNDKRLLKLKNQKVNTNTITMDQSDSNDSILSDFEDLSDTLENFGPGIDELSEDELYELQYLWDEESSDESIDDENPYRGSVKLSNKIDVKSKNLVSTRPYSQPYDYTSDESFDHVGLSSITHKSKPTPSFHPRTKLMPIEKTVNKVFTKTSRKTDESVSKKVDELTPNFPQKIISAETPKRKFQEPNKLNITIQDSQTIDAAFDRPFESNCNATTDKQLSLKREMQCSNKTDNPNISRDTNKSISESPFKRNYVEHSNKLSRLLGLSDYIKKNKMFLRTHTFLDDTSLDQKIKQITSKEVGMLRTTKGQNLLLDTKFTKNDNQSAISLNIIGESNVLSESLGNKCTNQESKNEPKLNLIKTKQKIGPKTLNIKNKKLSNITVKLDSLPNILLQPHSGHFRRKNQLQFNTDSSILMGKESADALTDSESDISDTKEPINKNSVFKEAEAESLTDSCSVLKFSQHKDNKSVAKQEVKTDSHEDVRQIKPQIVGTKVNIGNLPNKKGTKQTYSKNSVSLGVKKFFFSSSVCDNPASVKTNKFSFSLSSNIPKLLPVVAETCDTIESLKELKPATLTMAVERTPLYPPISRKGKDIEDLEAILTSGKGIDSDLCSNINNDAKSDITTATILKNDDLSFLFDDPRFETVVEEETLPPSMVAVGDTAGVPLVKITPTKKMVSDAPKETMLSMKEKIASKKKKSSEKTSKRKYDVLNASLDSASSIKNKAFPEKMVKYTKNSSLTTEKAGNNSNTSQIGQLFQAGQNRVITLLVYKTVPKISTPNRPVEEKLSNTPNKSLRKKFPKPEVDLSEDNTKVLSFTNGRPIPADTSNRIVKKGNSSLGQTRRTDLKESNRVADSMEYPEVKLLEENTKVLSFAEEIPTKLKVLTSKQNVNKRNSSSNQTRRSDLKEPSKALDSMEYGSSIYKRQYNTGGTNIQRSNYENTVLKQRDSKIKTDKVELARKKGDVQSKEAISDAYRIRRSKSNISSTKGAFITDAENTLNYIKTKPKNIADTEISEKTRKDAPKMLKNLKINMLDLVQPRRSSRGGILVTKEAKTSPIQELNLSKKAISNRGVKTRSQSKERGNLKEDNDNTSVKCMEFPSKMAHGQRLLKKEKMTGNTNLIQKRSISTVMTVRDQGQSEHKDDTALAGNSRKDRYISSNIRKTATVRQEGLPPKKGRSCIVQTENIRSKKRTKETSDKSLSQEEDKLSSSLCLVKDPVSLSSLKTFSTHETNRSTASPTMNYESDDFENSIVVSVLEKHRSPRKNLKSMETKKGGPLIISTPRKSIGYEDAFKIFLETSNRWPLNTEKQVQSQSDCEKDIDDSDWGLSGESRRRSKSVSSPKEQSFDNRKLVSGKMKKSVSWADGLNVIEYIQESDSDSDDSEIREVSKKNEFARGRRKRLSDEKRTFSKKSDRVTPRRKKQSETKSISQKFHPIFKSDDSDETQRYLPMSTTAMFQGKRISLVQTKDSFTLGNTLRQSTTPKSETTMKRFKNYTSTKNAEAKLVILLERNKEIDRMCVTLKNQRPAFLRNRRREGRIGYNELLYRARLAKKFDV